MGIEEKWRVKSKLKNVNKFFTYARMLELLTVAHKQFVIMLTDLKQVLSHELNCLYNKTTSHNGINHTKNYGCEEFLLY